MLTSAKSTTAPYHDIRLPVGKTRKFVRLYLERHVNYSANFLAYCARHRQHEDRKPALIAIELRSSALPSTNEVLGKC